MPGTTWAFQLPSWSHDGGSLTYQVDDFTDQPATAPGYDIAVYDLATGTEQILTNGFPEHAIVPMFAPDDRRILFATGVGVGVVGADGTEPPRIVARTECVAPPQPSPDARFFTCVAQRQVARTRSTAGRPRH